MRGIRPNLCRCTWIEDSNRVESAGRSAYTSKWVTIWFSASWILTSLPNSLGLLAFPLRIISVCGSNTLTIFSGDFEPHTERSEEHTSELQSHLNLVSRLLL